MAPTTRSWAALIILALALCCACPVTGGPPDYAEERAAMVKHLRELGINSEPVLTAMRDVPRHLFVSVSDPGGAYQDIDLPAGTGQSCCRPYVTALTAQALDLEPGRKVLQVGAKCGYYTAILCKLTPDVHVIDNRPEVADPARSRLREMGYSSIAWKTGDACKGWPEHGPYDAIVVTCATQQVPEELVRQLAEGGRMVIPVGSGPAQTLLCVRKMRRKPPLEGIMLRSETMTSIRVRADPMTCQRGPS